MSVLPAVSTIQQGDFIKRLIESKGYEVEYKKTISIYDIKDKDVYGILWFSLATTPYIADAVFPYLYCNKPKAVYVTIEGVPTKANIRYSNLPRLEFIAVSNFVANCLRKVGLKVKDVCHHAIDIQQCQRIMKEAKKYREKLHEKYYNKCILLYVGRNDPRKQLKLLLLANEILYSQGFHDYVLMLHTDESAKAMNWQQNVQFTTGFGSMSYQSVLKLIACADYLIFPSVCEGFGLPVLEANALGIPAIHCWFAPLSEFSNTDFNFVFDYIEEKLVSQDNLQWWIFHMYDPEHLAEMMKYAVETWKSDKEQYLEYCTKAHEHASKWDYRKIYPRLLRHLNIK